MKVVCIKIPPTFADERSKCASIRTLGDGVSILCQDCIEGILESLDPSAARDIKIDKILQ